MTSYTTKGILYLNMLQTQIQPMIEEIVAANPDEKSYSSKMEHPHIILGMLGNGLMILIQIGGLVGAVLLNGQLVPLI